MSTGWTGCEHFEAAEKCLETLTKTLKVGGREAGAQVLAMAQVHATLAAAAASAGNYFGEADA
jgi:hypothetical protein